MQHTHPELHTSGDFIDPAPTAATQRDIGHVASHIPIDAPAPQDRHTVKPSPERIFNPETSLVSLELFSRRKVLFVALDDFPVSDTSGHTYQIPPEAKVFNDRNKRFEDIFAGTPTSLLVDQRQLERGTDIYKQVHDIARYFLVYDRRGQQVCQELSIEASDLDSLEPSQAIKLIGHLMHSLTRYETSAITLPEYTHSHHARADDMGTVSMLRNGLDAKTKGMIEPLGVCRNFANTAATVFASLKHFNPRLSNVYTHTAVGYGGSIYGNITKVTEPLSSHAWVDFFAVDQQGNLAITTVDPTWVKTDEGSLKGFDLTYLRLGTHLRNLAVQERVNYASSKARNLERLSKYYMTRIKGLTARLAKQYPSTDGRLHLKNVDDNDPMLQAAMYRSVDYIATATKFGGGAFDSRFVDQSVKQYVLHAAKSPDFMFSPVEYEAVMTVLRGMIESTPPNSDKHASLEKILVAVSSRNVNHRRSHLYRYLEKNEGAP